MSWMHSMGGVGLKILVYFSVINFKVLKRFNVFELLLNNICQRILRISNMHPFMFQIGLNLQNH